MEIVIAFVVLTVISFLIWSSKRKQGEQLFNKLVTLDEPDAEILGIGYTIAKGTFSRMGMWDSMSQERRMQSAELEANVLMVHAKDGNMDMVKLAISRAK